MLHAEPLAGAAESGDDLVRDHQHFEVVADVAHAGEPAERRDDAAAGALHGLHDDGRNGFRVRVAYGVGERVRATAHEVFVGAGAPVPERVRNWRLS